MALSVIEVLKKTEEFFLQKNIPNARLDAQLLLAKALNKKRLELFLLFDKPMQQNELDLYREFVRRRAKREPLQYIVGECEFYNALLKCDRRALIPRSETEELCALVCEKYFADKKDLDLKILDMGTGSGAIAVALAVNFKNAKVFACDISENALSLAAENAALNNVCIEFVKSDWFENIEGKFDIIISNPPYLTEEEVESAQSEVRDFEPYNALFSENNGFADLQKIVENAKSRLNENGVLFFETGIAHKTPLESLAKKFGFLCETLPDLSGRQRYGILRVAK